MSEAPLSRRERQIMDVVYTHGEATARLLEEKLPDAPSNTAIRTMLRILETKGHLKHKKVGREFVYQPTRPREKAGRSAFRRVVETFFEGSLEQAVAAHLSDPKTKLDAEGVRRLQELIRVNQKNT